MIVTVRVCVVLAGATVVALLSVSSAFADPPALVHIVREGETLASIAQRYYGDPRRESVLVAENGLNAEGGAQVVVGTRLVVPTVGYHRVEEGESWAVIAARYYGTPTRAFVLMELNGGSAAAVAQAGAEVLIPYPVRYVASQTDTLRSIAQTYYGSDSGPDAARLRRFNPGRRSMRARVPRGVPRCSSS